MENWLKIEESKAQAVCLGFWSWAGRPVAQGSARQKKPPTGCTPPEGVSAHAPPGHLPTRRAYEPGGVSIAALLSQGLLPDRSSCREALDFTYPTSFYMSHSRWVVKNRWVFL
jgi:hypothetical protein